ncbi:MAG: tape measure protein, partial [bacterium]
ANLTRTLTGLGGLLTVRQLVEYADAWTLIAARTRIVTSSLEQAIVVQNRLYEISQNSRTQLSATAVLYTRLAFVSRNLGKSQEDLLNVVEAVNNAVLVSGATGVEAAQSIRQIAQAFGKGKLDGDEFRTVMEAMPLVSRAIADELGVVEGALFDLSKAGKITSKVMVEAMLKAQKQLAEEAASMPWTIGQSFIYLRNSLTRVIGILNMGYGASAKFSEGMRWMADNIEKVLALIPAVISMWISYRITMLGVAAAQALVTSQQTIT